MIDWDKIRLAYVAANDSDLVQSAIHQNLTTGDRVAVLTNRPSFWQNGTSSGVKFLDSCGDKVHGYRPHCVYVLSDYVCTEEKLNDIICGFMSVSSSPTGTVINSHIVINERKNG